MKSPDPEVILELAQALKDAKAHLASLQTRWDSYFAPIGNSHDLPFPPKRGKRPMAESNTGKILAKLAENPTETYGKEDMAREIGIAAKKAERTLIKLFSTGKIVRTGRGRYSAKPLGVAA